MVHGIQHQLNPGRDTQLVKDAKQIFLDRVLAEIEFARRIAIAEPFSNQRNHLFFPGREQHPTVGVHHAQRRRFGNRIQQEVHLFGICPDLTFGDPLDASAKQAEVRVGETEDSPGAGAKSADDQFPVLGLSQKHFWDGRIGDVNLAHGRHLIGNFHRWIEGQN